MLLDMMMELQKKNLSYERNNCKNYISFVCIDD
jgi:hypothetical protein